MFLGRFTAALRVLIPGLAGMSGMEYRTFAVYNIAGGTIWATGFVLLGYVGGSSYRHVESIAKKASLLLLLLVVVVGATVFVAKRIAANPERLRALGSRVASLSFVSAVRSRLRRQLDFLLRRFQPRAAVGLSLTTSLALLALTGWGFGVVVQDVLSGESFNPVDRPVLDFVVAHREPWLTSVATIHQRLRDDHGLGVSESSLRRFIWANFDEEVARDAVRVLRDTPPPATRPRSTMACWAGGWTRRRSGCAGCGASSSS